MHDLNSLLRGQILHAYNHAPAVRNLMDEAGVTPEDIQTVSDLDRLPVISKDRLQDIQQQYPPLGGFLAVPVTDLKRIYLSPGPIYDPQSHQEESARLVAEEAFTATGFIAHDLVINTFMYHMVPAGLLMDEALLALGATVIPMGPGNTEAQIKVIQDLGVTAYVGTPSFLEIIYSKAEQMGIPFGEMPLRKAFFSAEYYTPSQRQLFEGTYGLITSQAYATADVGMIAYERPGYSGLYIPQYLIVQVCDPETGATLEYGQTGEVVVTTFNKTYPLVRFGTGDLSIMQAEIDADGNSRQKLLGLLARSGEAIKVRGMFLHPNAIKKAASQFDNIKTIQAVIGREGSRDTVAIEVVLNAGDLNSEALRSAIKETARLSIDTVEIVDQVEGTRTVRDTRVYS